MPMRRLSHLFAGLLLAIGAGTLAAADMNKTLRVAFPVAESGFDPQAIADNYSAMIAQAIFEPLYTYDYLARPSKVVPLAADLRSLALATKGFMPEVEGDALHATALRSRASRASWSPPIMSSAGSASSIPRSPPRTCSFSRTSWSAPTN